MPLMLIFGLGYTAKRLARRLTGDGWEIVATGEAGRLSFDDRDSVLAAIARATHILSSVPPGHHSDPVLAHYAGALASAPARWIGYLSSTGVYGDTEGAWVDESAPTGGGRRLARSQADQAWRDLRPDMRIFRLPGIYGPGRSALDRVRSAEAQRLNLPGQVFSRVHVDDIASGVIASFSGPAGVYNLADDAPAPQNAVIEYSCALLGVDPPLILPLDQANLSAAARAFYDENRRVANGKAKRLLGWRPRYCDYRAGLTAIHLSEQWADPA